MFGRPLSDRAFFATAIIAGAVLVALSFVWPQGFGRPSPGPFGEAQRLSQAAKQDLANAAKKAASSAKPAPAGAKR
jgi:hypothetical protein